MFLVFLVFNRWNAMNYGDRQLFSPAPLTYTGTIQKSRTGDPDWEDLSKSPVPVRFAHLWGLGSSVGTSGLDTTFSSIPGEARVLLSCTMNPSSTPKPWIQASSCTTTESIERNPKKTPLLQRANEKMSGLVNRNTGSRKHAVLQPTRFPVLPVASRGQV